MNIFDALSSPLSLVGDPSRRLFWGFILSSVLIILISWVWQKKSISWRRIKLTFFSASYWFNRSTLVDISLLILNMVLRLLLLVPLFGSHLLGAMWVAKLLQRNLDTAPQWELPWIVIAVLFTLTFFIVEDLSRFLLHKLMHSNKYLWRIHKTHHSATTLTPLTLHRIHPIEMTLYYVRGMVVFSLVSGVFIYVFSNRLTSLDIMGVDALGFLFNMLGANLRHSHIWIGFGKLEKIFISPAQHQIHHSSELRDRDINFGSTLAIWDSLFKSWVPSGKKRKLRFGVEPHVKPSLKPHVKTQLGTPIYKNA